MSFSAPSFYNVFEFADIFQLSPAYIRHGARSFSKPQPENRAKLPDGYGAFQWSGIYIIFALDEQAAIEKMFNVKVGR